MIFLGNIAAIRTYFDNILFATIFWVGAGNLIFGETASTQAAKSLADPFLEKIECEHRP